MPFFMLIYPSEKYYYNRYFGHNKYFQSGNVLMLKIELILC